MRTVQNPETEGLTSMSRSRQVKLLARHEAFWLRKGGSGALIGYAPTSRMFPLQNLRIKHEGEFRAEDVTEELIKADTEYRPGYETGDDLFPGKIPLEPLAWSEGYCGANVNVSSRAQTVWCKHGEKVPESLEEVEHGRKPAWRLRLRRATEVNQRQAAGAYFISEALLRGPADCLEALIGAERLCLWMYDRPELVRAVMDKLTEWVKELYESQFEVLEKFHGGTINRYRLWGPGRNIVMQADIANVMSPGHFRELFVPSYRRLAQAFDTVTMHFHSSAAQHVEALLEIEELAAIEWALDPTGPGLEKMAEVFARIQQAGKGVIVMNLKNQEEVSMLLERLEPEGLCLIVRKDY